MKLELSAVSFGAVMLKITFIKGKRLLFNPAVIVEIDTRRTKNSQGHVTHRLKKQKKQKRGETGECFQKRGP